jgi:hypothetical protein
MQPPITPMTLGNMRANGVQLLCHVLAIASVINVAHAQVPNSTTKLPTERQQAPPPHVTAPKPPQTLGKTPSVIQHNLHGRPYRGRLPWEKGRWRHAKRNGRFGWWWDVGGIWYFYPEPVQGPPAYVSDGEADDTEGPVTPAEPQLKEPPQVFYYQYGDLKGIPYNTLEECQAAVEKAGNGICVIR